MTAAFGAIVVAAGAGTRMAADRPKALLPLQGTPLVRWSADAMITAGADPVVVVVPSGGRDQFTVAVTGCAKTSLVEGGLERTHSVRNGLNAILALRATARPAHVLIHDAARPLVPQSVIARVTAALAEGAGAVVPVIPVTDSIRQVTQAGSAPVDRRQLRAVQTPQGFDVDVLAGAYRQIGDEVVSDDAGVCERAGHPIHLVDGAVEALKITHRSDFRTAVSILEGDRPTFATGSSASAVGHTAADSVR